jgi:hypothetical protein
MAFFDDMSAASAAYPMTDVGEQSTSKVRVTNTTHRRALIALAAALAVSFGATSQAGAAGLACKPDVFVENAKGASIKVLRFEYTVLGKVHTEALATATGRHHRQSAQSEGGGEAALGQALDVYL